MKSILSKLAKIIEKEIMESGSVRMHLRYSMKMTAGGQQWCVNSQFYFGSHMYPFKKCIGNCIDGFIPRGPIQLHLISV